MRYKELNEQWFNTYKVEDHHIEVFINPSKTEFLKLITALERKHGADEWPLRAFVTPTDLYVWDAFFATHNDMRNHDIPNSGGYLYLNREGIMFNDLHMEHSEGGELPYGPDIRRYFEATIANPSIRRLYGPEPKIIGWDDENLSGLGTRVTVDKEFVERFCE